MSAGELRVEDGPPGTWILTLDRPHRLNALTTPLVEELLAVLDRAEADPSVRVVVLTGAGRGFCSGWDLAEGASAGAGLAVGSAQAGMRLQRSTARLIRRLRDGTVPVIAAVNGPAVGGGFSLALACDVRLAATSASFGAPFVRLGLSGGDLGTSWLLPRAVGSSRSAEILLTGRTVDAAEADRIGLVSAVHPDADLVDAAVAMAGAIAAHSPFAVALTKEVLWAGLEIGSLHAAMELENRTQILATTTADHVEAVAARAEGRPPVFRDA